MDLNKLIKLLGSLYPSIFIGAAALLSAYAYWLLSPAFAESIGRVAEAAPNSFMLFSLDTDMAKCPDTFIDQATEGPYYKTGSPERSDLIEEGVIGEPITLTGYVFDKDCNPVAGAWLDFWQANGNGNYDNRGYRLRGHQFTDKRGKYLLRTVMPGEYPGRTSHIHVKVGKQADGVITTSQLYFPGRKQNAEDRIFSKSMVIMLDKSMDGGNVGYFNFRLNQ
jgi:hypothetical protein